VASPSHDATVEIVLLLALLILIGVVLTSYIR
jgi:hypothetical protein